MSENRRVVITGLGLISPIGIGAEASWTAAVAGKVGIGPITQFDASTYPVRIAGEVKDFDPATVHRCQRNKEDGPFYPPGHGRFDDGP